MMNERIKELAEQAEDYSYTEYAKKQTGYTREDFFKSKFAELIVRECADISDASFHNGSAGYTAILKHFGVEQ